MYNHAFTIALEVVSSDKDGADITPAMFRQAMLNRIAQLDREGWEQVMTDKPFDTYEIEEH